jgi:hypothetical protein
MERRIKADLDSLERRLLYAINQPHSRFGFRIGQAIGKCPPTQETPIMEITINNEQKVQVTLAPVTTGGNPAPLDGVPTWDVISGDSTVEPEADGKSAWLISGNDPGDTQIIVKADADLGEGVVEISDIISLSVQGAQAANLGLVAGTPEAK